MQKEILLISLFACHWLADFTWLSMPFMLNAKGYGKPLPPIFLHACVHGALMLIPMLILVGANNLTAGLIITQIFSHFIIDVCKGRLNYHFPIFRDSKGYPHWVIFGFDQLLHTTVIILMAYFATK